jgi:transcriptional regulator with XRE-family HTH domain
MLNKKRGAALNRIKDLRLEEKMTIEELATLSAISSRQLSDIENDKCDPKTSTLINIATALNTTISYLLYESEEKDRRRCNVKRSEKTQMKLT